MTATTVYYLCHPDQDLLVGTTVITMEDSDGDDFSSLTDGLSNFNAMSGDTQDLLDRARASIDNARASTAAFR